MIRACTGPKGEPGFAAETDGTLGTCHVYDPANPLSKLAAERAVVDELRQAETARIATEQPA